MALLHHWKLDDNAASTTVVATVGTNASLLGGENTNTKQAGTGPGGLINSSFALDGIDDQIDISAAAFSRATTLPWSYSVWFKMNTIGAHGLIGVQSSSNSRVITQLDTQILVRITTSVFFDVPTMSTGVWYHLLVTKNSSNQLRLFLNGTESTTGALAGGTSTFSPNRLGNGSLGGAWIDGSLAWAKLFNTDESSNVATLYAEGVSAGGGGGANLTKASWYYQLPMIHQ
jgi:hypothetical protein